MSVHVIIKTLFETPKVIITTVSGGCFSVFFFMLAMFFICSGLLDMANEKIEEIRKSSNPNYITSKEKKEIEKNKAIAEQLLGSGLQQEISKKIRADPKKHRGSPIATEKKALILEGNEGFLVVYWRSLAYGVQSRGGSYLYKTQDGGKNWKELVEIDTEANYPKDFVVTVGDNEAIKSFNYGNCWQYIKNNTIIAKTNDKGLSWDFNRK